MTGIVTGIAHVGYTTDDLEKAVDFHVHKLGIENKRTQVSDQPYISKVTGVKDCRLKIGFVRTVSDDLPLEIIEYIYPKGLEAKNELGRIGASHICWKTDDLQAAVARLRNQNIDTISEPEVFASGPWKHSRRVFLRSPDGLPIELLAPDGSDGDSGRLFGLHHVSFAVSDVCRVRRFFCDQLGMEEIAQRQASRAHRDSDRRNIPAEAAYIGCPNSELVIELLKCRAGKDEVPGVAVNDVGCVHLCLMVHDISDAYEALTKKGIEFVGPPAQVTCGVNKGALAIYLQGPEGIKCELFQGPPTRVS